MDACVRFGLPGANPLVLNEPCRHGPAGKVTCTCFSQGLGKPQTMEAPFADQVHENGPLCSPQPRLSHRSPHGQAKDRDPKLSGI